VNARHESVLPPETFTVLGKRLEDFSISHALWLQRLGCVPVDSFSTLITAVLVCSRPVEDIRATLGDRWLNLKVWWWGKRLGKFDIKEKIDLFNAYVDAHSKGPDIFTEEEMGGGIPGAPWLQHLRVSLITRGFRHDYVDRVRYGQALWDYYTMWENEGKASILGDEVETIKEWADANHEEILRQANADAQERREGGG
jgi:hypothetical protein